MIEVTLSASRPSHRVDIGSLDPLTHGMAVRLAPLRWSPLDCVRINLVVLVDGAEHRVNGQVTGGRAMYSLFHSLPTGFFGGETPYRYGEQARVSYRAYVEFEHVHGAPQFVADISWAARQVSPWEIHHSVAFDTASNVIEQGGDGVVSLSHTASGSNRAAFVTVGVRTSTAGVGTTSYGGGGGSLTSVFSEENTTFEVLMYGFSKTAPDTSSQTVSSDITATTPSDHFLGVITMTGVDQTTPTGTAASDPIAFDVSPSATVSSVNADDMVVDFLVDQNSPTVGANQTERINPANTSFPTYFRVSTQAGSDGGVMSWTHTGNGTRGLHALAFKAAPTGPVPSLYVISSPLRW